MNVLYEDNHLLVINKPPELATMGAQSGEESVYQWASDYIRHRYNKPGNVFVGIVSRLDAMTSGALVLARTSKAASRLSIQFGGPGKNKKVSAPAEKLYLTIVEGDLEKDSGLSRSDTLVDDVWKDDGAHRMRVARSPRDGTKLARLRYSVLGKHGTNSILAVRLLTGRKHQIRLQFADRGHPVLGDRKYGSKVDFPLGVALHSWQLLITHPTKATPMRFVADLPRHWEQSGAEHLVGGDYEAAAVRWLEWSVDTAITTSV